VVPWVVYSIYAHIHTIAYLLGRQVLGHRQLQGAPVRQGEEVLDKRLPKGPLPHQPGPVFMFVMCACYGCGLRVFVDGEDRSGTHRPLSWSAAASASEEEAEPCNYQETYDG
jgi:hypothetical protein